MTTTILILTVLIILLNKIDWIKSLLKKIKFIMESNFNEIKYNDYIYDLKDRTK